MESVRALPLLCLVLLSGCLGPDAANHAGVSLEAPRTGWWGQNVTLVIAGPSGALVPVSLDGKVVAAANVLPSGTAEVQVLLPRPGALTFQVGEASATLAARVPERAFAEGHEGRGSPAQKQESARPLPEGYDVRERDLHGTRLVVAYAPGIPATIGGEGALPIDEMTGLLAAGFEHHWHVFAGFPYDTMTWVFERPGSGCEEVLSQTYYRVCADVGSAPHPLTFAMAHDWAVHETFHAWNQGVFFHTADGPGVLQAESWLAEGATVYYTARANARPESVQGYADMMGEAVATYGGHQGGALDIPFHDLAAMTEAEHEGGPPREGEHVDMIYHKGALVAQALDADLAAMGHDLDELMRWLYAGGAGRQYGNADLQAQLETMTGSSWQAFFEDRVHGTEPVPTGIVYVDHLHRRALEMP